MTAAPPHYAIPQQRQGGARFVGDAQPIPGLPISRMLNAACYLITGIAAFVIAGSPHLPTVWPVLIGIWTVGYGVKILVTRSAYWVSSGVYVCAFLAVGAAIGWH